VGDRITVEGFVEKLFVKEGTSQRGPWKAYSIKLQRVSGEVDPRFYQFGFDKPGFAEGDYIRFEADVKDDKTAQFVQGSGSKPKNPPTKPAKPAAQSGGKGGYNGPRGGSSGPKEKDSKMFGKIGGYNTEDDIRRMSYSAARGDAVALVLGLLAHDALPMSAAKTKAGQAQRYDEVTKAVDKLTIEYFFDSASGRKLTSVADAGSTESRVTELPTAQPGKTAPAQAETTDPDEPPPDVDETDEQQQDEDYDGKF
jgi:hypothetical protein